MGIYVNPTNKQTQLAWVEERQVAKSGAPSLSPNTESVLAKVDYKTIYPVCLVDNGPFTACAVADTTHEFNLFDSIDGRPKIWYAIPVCELINPSSGLMPSDVRILKQQGNY